jgi:hypothetical protein
MIKIDPKAEVEQLLNELYPFAEKMLRTYAEFNPFAGYIDATGRMVHVSIEDVETEETGKSKHKRLVDGLKEEIAKKGARACGFVVNVTLPGHNGVDTEDAIRIFLEHKDGYCADVFYCYLLNESNDVSVTKNYAQQGTPVFFN